MKEQKIRQDKTIHIGENIRRLRLERGMGQADLLIKMQLEGSEITRETLFRMEKGLQHIPASQLRLFRDILRTTYDELLRDRQHP